MSLFFRAPKAEARAVTSIEGWGRGDDTLSPDSMKSALGVIPVFAATRLITDAISTLPVQAYRKTADSRVPMDLPTVLDSVTRIEWLQQALFSLLLRGNAYGYATSENPVYPKRVVWLNPEDVQVDESGPQPVYRWKGRELEPSRVKHIPAYALPGSVVGVSPIGACSMLTSTGAATQRMMRDWFKGRALPGSTFQNMGKVLDAGEAEKVSDRLNARLRNGKPLVYGSDWKFDAVTLSADDAAFISATKLSATQVASIYGLPPETIGGETGSSLTYATTESNDLSLSKYALRPWVRKLEQEFTGWLPAPQYVKFNLGDFVSVDLRTRHEVYQIDRNIGLKNIDELRALEDEPPLPDGVGQDYTPLAKSRPTTQETTE